MGIKILINLNLIYVENWSFLHEIQYKLRNQKYLLLATATESKDIRVSATSPLGLLTSRYLYAKQYPLGKNSWFQTGCGLVVSE